MAQLEEDFRSSLTALLGHAGWQPHSLSGPERRIYFGGDRQRDYIQVDFWAVLDADPRSPTILAEIDTIPADLEHNVAKYFWLSSVRKPFWTTPAILISAYRQIKPKDYRVHENIAAYLGAQLCVAVPGMAHTIVNLRGEQIGGDAGSRLAQLAFLEVQRWLAQL